jgi:hypothetical protein
MIKTMIRISISSIHPKDPNIKASCYVMRDYEMNKTGTRRELLALPGRLDEVRLHPLVYLALKGGILPQTGGRL